MDMMKDAPKRVELREEVARAINPGAFQDGQWLTSEISHQASSEAQALRNADAAIALVVERCAQIAERTATGEHGDYGRGKDDSAEWIASLIRDLAPQPEARS